MDIKPFDMPASIASAGSVSKPPGGSDAADGGANFLMALLRQLVGGEADSALPAVMADAQGESLPDSDAGPKADSGSDEGRPALAAGGNTLPLPLPLPMPVQPTPLPGVPATNNGAALGPIGGRQGSGSGQVADAAILRLLESNLTGSETRAPRHDVAPATVSAGGDAGATGNPGLAASALAMPTPSTPASPPPALPVNLPVQHPQWGQDMGSKVVWMLGQGVQDARLQLHPSHLGPVQVHVTVQDNQASIHFTAQHPDTRDALQASLPQLRDMLSQHGVQLGQAQVNAQAQGQNGQPQPYHPVPGEGLRGGGEVEESAATPTLTRRLQGLVDDYA